jgi:hypothetical protein
MSQHLSTELWTILDGKGSLLHIETSCDSEESGRHICSVNKKEEKVACLIMLAPELLNLVYKLRDAKEDLPADSEIKYLKHLAKKLIDRFNADIKQ